MADREKAKIAHVVEVVSWEFAYHFGINRGLPKELHSDGPYVEYRHLVIGGKVLAPKLRAVNVRITVFPQPTLTPQELRTTRPKPVGYVSYRGKDYSAGLEMPSDAFPLVLQMFAAEKYRFVKMASVPTGSGEADIDHYFFSGSEPQLD